MRPERNKHFHCQNNLIQCSGSTQYPPFKKHALHTHERCELFCTFRGSGFYITEGSRHRLEPGRIFLMRPGEMHKIDLQDTEPRETIAFHFHPSVVDSFDPQRRLLSSFFDRPLGLNNVYDQNVLSPTEVYPLLHQMFRQTDSKYDNCAHVTALLIAVLDQLKLLFDAGLYNAPSESAELMHAVLNYVNQNLTAEITPELLCEKFHFSRAQLDRSFKSTTGSTASAYITAKRLLLAKSYMDEGMRATEAAIACGFRDYSTFYRVCCKHFGSAPSDIAAGAAPEKVLLRRD